MSRIPEQVQAALSGPIASLRTPFTRGGDVDYDGLRAMVDFSIDARSACVLLTAGDSHLICMSDAEISEVTRVVAAHTAGRVPVVAADWEFATPQAVAFATAARDLGATLVMARPPDWQAGCTEQTLVDHFRALAEVMPVMLVTNLFAARAPRFGLQVIDRLCDEVPGVVAVKDDIGGDFARQLAIRVRGRMALISGGGMRNHLQLWPYGCGGLMCRHMSFRPQITWRYWEMLHEAGYTAAAGVIEALELPLERLLAAAPGGRDAGVHALFEIYGIAGRWRRPPYYSLDDAEVERLAEQVAALELP